MAQARYKIAEARARFSELVERASRGEEITILRGETVRARLVPAEEVGKRVFGALRHLSLPDDLFDRDDPLQGSIDAGEHTDAYGIWREKSARSNS